MEEYYVDKEDGLYHVFHTKTGRSHASYTYQEEAEGMAEEMNDGQ